MEGNSTEARPEIIRYRGDQLVIIRQAPREFGPGAFACFDLNGNGTFERQVRVDETGWFDIALDAGQLPHDGNFFMTFRSENGEKKSQKGIISSAPVHSDMKPATAWSA